MNTDIEEKEGKGTSYKHKDKEREADKGGKETRALQVPCWSETYGYSGEKNR
jgi:hypothetical protein